MRAIFLSLAVTSSLLSCVNHEIRPEIYDCAQSDLALQIASVAPATSCGTSDGSITVEATGGVAPYVFESNLTRQSTGAFTNLSSGVYTIAVIDGKDCKVVLPNISVNAAGFQFEAIVQESTDCAGGNGSIVINVNEGQAPFQFKFGDSPFAENNTFINLGEGSYDIILKDANDCFATLNVTVPQGNTGTSWSSTIKPLMTTYCALTGCHNGKSRPDLRLYNEAKFYASEIKSLTADKSMPYEGKLTQAQIDLIACWVDEGAPDN